jgi:hypothetical protein
MNVNRSSFNRSRERAGPRLGIGCLYLLALPALTGAFPAFTVHRIDSFGAAMGQTALIDVDRDGDLDWVVGNASHAKERPAEISWWEFQSPDKWVRHELGRGHTDVGGAAWDVNGDGWVDFVAGSVLLLNSREPRSVPFISHDIGTLFSHDTEFADVNGDGKMDLIANHETGGLAWFEIPEDPTTRWKKHLIAQARVPRIHGGVSPKAVADIDGDGDNDIVSAQAWYENLGAGLKWAEHRNIDLGEAKRYGISVRTWTGDLDGDGDIDLVQAENDHPDGRIAWFENDGRGGWTRHMIRDRGQGQDWHSLAVADFDGDGDSDVYAGAGPLSGSKNFACYIWENTGKGRSWTEHTLVTGKQCHEAEAGDVDGDGDIDICTKPWNGTNEHFFFRNMLRERQILESPAR